MKEETKQHDCFDDIENAIHAGRARWVCRECKRDISLMYFLWFSSMQNDSMHGYDDVAYGLVNKLPAPKGE